MHYTYDYPRPALTVDTVVFGVDQPALQLLLIERAHPPFEGHWALPGGFVEMDEGLCAAAQRELTEETGVRGAALEQLHTFGTPGRDPRGRTVSVVFLTVVRCSEHPIRPASDARDAAWLPASRLPPLAFDHERIVAMARARLERNLRHAPFGRDLLPEEFTLRNLQDLYETVLERPLDARRFRRRILSTGLLCTAPDRCQASPSRRTPRRYRFDQQQYQRLTQRGMHLDL